MNGLDLTIRRFGKVIDARVKTTPLTILVGKNNTGKSYISTLMWSMGDLYRLIIRDKSKDFVPEWYASIYKNLGEDKAAHELLIDSDKAKDLITFLNKILRANGKLFFKDTFAFDGFVKADVSVNLPEYVPLMSLQVELDPLPRNGRRKQLRFRITNSDNDDIYENTLPYDSTMFFTSDYILSLLLTKIIYGEIHVGSTYVPAARTGLMLAYRKIVSQLLDTTALDQNTGPRFQLPMNVTQFLQELTYNFAPEGQAAGEVADWLESQLLGGHLALTDDQIPIITYRPRGTDLEIPLHAASSMITELAPFLIALRRSLHLNQITLEEPEAHLHLSAQRMMAQAIARLVNSGINVIVTTHSDTLVQQINNRICSSRSGVGVVIGRGTAAFGQA